MIRVTVTDEQLIGAIDAHRPKWRSSKEPAWSEIKDVYRELQLNKCIYCERELLSGPIEWDIEHYRPKNQVVKWLGYKTGRAKGYPWMAHSPFNYAVSCKPCNSEIKKCGFPIDGTVARSVAKGKRTADEVIDLNSRERPLLLFPFGWWDLNDPEMAIQWQGVVPIGKTKRGKVTVEFFDLSRPDLCRQRALALLCKESAASLASGLRPFSACRRALQRCSKDERALLKTQCEKILATSEAQLLERREARLRDEAPAKRVKRKKSPKGRQAT